MGVVFIELGALVGVGKFDDPIPWETLCEWSSYPCYGGLQGSDKVIDSSSFPFNLSIYYKNMHLVCMGSTILKA